jgi:TPR repeat protein
MFIRAFLFCSVFAFHSFAAEAPTKTCRSGNGGICFQLGLDLQGKGELKEATALYRMGCGKKHALSCNKVGSMIMLVDNEPKKAEKYFQLACDLGDGGGCNQIAEEAKRLQDKAKALKYYQLGCKKGFPQSCFNQAILKKNQG